MQPQPQSWLIQKFGGTSVGSADRMRQMVEIIRSASLAYRPIVVLSAMSGTQKSQGTTSRLLEAADDVLIPQSTRYLDIVEELERDHLKAAQEAVPDLRLRSQLTMELRQEFQKLRNFLEACEIIDEISPRSRDVIIGTGEKLACRIFAAVLESHGLAAVYIPLDKLIDQHLDESQLDQQFYDELKLKLAHLLLKESGVLSDTFKIPIVTGFMGYIPGGIIKTIGRGYTDFTAALITAGLKLFPGSAETVQKPLVHDIASDWPESLPKVAQEVYELQIWKEVDGVFTADPRKVPGAKLLTRLYPEEAAELTYYGSEVIHPFTMEQVIRAQVGIRIKNTFAPDGPGTEIMPGDFSSRLQVQHHAEGEEFADVPLKQNEIRATAVTLKTDVMCLNIHSNRKSVSHGFLAKIFSTLDRHGIVVDLISTSEVHVSMALSAHYLNNNSKLELLLKDLKAFGTVSVLDGMAILSLVGKQMRHMVGIAGKMFSILAQNHVNIEVISQGASEINISCVILEEDAGRALKCIHDGCVL